MTAEGRSAAPGTAAGAPGGTAARQLGPVTVDAPWLAEHLDDVVLLDVRGYLDGRSGRAAYDRGHLPGAVWVDRDRVLSAPPAPDRGRHPFPAPEQFAAALGDLGVPDDAHVVAYDDAGPGPGAGGTGAARLAWMLRRTGQPAAVLDGGVGAWRGPLDVHPVRRDPVTRSARPWPPGLVVDADVAAAAPLVLDARASERYRGDVEPVDPRAGHIPGARNVPYTTTMRADGTLRDREQLRSVLAPAGVVDGGPAPVVYCGSGITACHLLLAIEDAGLGVGRLYAGSWSQWSNDPSRPVATGDA